MGIGILIPEAMISKSTIDKLASVDEKEIPTVSDLMQEMFEYLVQFQMAQRDSRPILRHGFSVAAYVGDGLGAGRPLSVAHAIPLNGQPLAIDLV